VLSGAQARQTGKVFRGPGASKYDDDDVPELSSYQEECLRKAKKYAMEQNVKIAVVRNSIVQQQQVRLSEFLKMPKRLYLYENDAV